MAKTARQWSPIDKAAVRILAKIRAEDHRDLSYRQMAKLTGMTPSRLSGLFLETMGPPTLDEFCTLCELFNRSAPQTLQSVIVESQSAVDEPAFTNVGMEADSIDRIDIDALASDIAAHPERYAQELAANYDPNKDNEMRGEGR